MLDVGDEVGWKWCGLLAVVVVVVVAQSGVAGRCTDTLAVQQVQGRCSYDARATWDVRRGRAPGSINTLAHSHTSDTRVCPNTRGTMPAQYTVVTQLIRSI